MMGVLSCCNLGKYYREGGQKHWVLKGIDLQLEQGQMLVVMGRSGSGKSTLLHCASGLESFDQGDVLWHERSLKKYTETQKRHCYAHNMGFVYQQHGLLLDLTALENTMIPLNALGLPYKKMQHQASTLLDQMGLYAHKDYPVHHLSGGERQRVALARALIHNPKWVLADEPTASLDATNRDQIIALIKDYQARKKTAFLIATHDVALSKQADAVYDFT